MGKKILAMKNFIDILKSTFFNPFRAIFDNDAHSIISKKGLKILFGQERFFNLRPEITPTKYIDYEGFRYWYEYMPARHRKDTCLATKDPVKYCNGFYLYSTKDPGNGFAYVVIKHNNPSENWMQN